LAQAVFSSNLQSPACVEPALKFLDQQAYNDGGN